MATRHCTGRGPDSVWSVFRPRPMIRRERLTTFAGPGLFMSLSARFCARSEPPASRDTTTDRQPARATGMSLTDGAV
jgi:hypothetical protein